LPSYIFAADRPANLVFAVSSLSGRSLRTAPAHFSRRNHVRRQLGTRGSLRQSLALYLTYGVIGGFGPGIIYVGIIGLMVRWFPDRRGLAAGLAAAGYGFGAIFTSFPIDSMIKSSGYAHTLVVWGIIQGVVGVIAAQGLRLPPENYQAPSAAIGAGGPQQSARSYSPTEMLRNPIFWLLFIMMSMMSTSGLMVVSNVGPAFLKQTTGSWTAVFIAVAVLDAITAALAITVLRRTRQRHFGAR
jgi:OFA family oxalate/formate antiporter-like MFS transporter